MVSSIQCHHGDFLVVWESSGSEFIPDEKCPVCKLKKENARLKRQLKKAIEKSRPSPLAVLMDSGT